MLKRGVILYSFLLIWSAFVAEAGEAKIIKVLPHYLDLEGRHSLSPSLYERDAYQDYLRKNRDQRSALRFDLQWKAKAAAGSNLRVRLELRTTKTHLGKPLVLEQPVKRSRWFSTWSALTIQGDAYQKVGDLIAWRATLWDGERQVAELRSYLW